MKTWLRPMPAPCHPTPCRRRGRSGRASAWGPRDSRTGTVLMHRLILVLFSIHGGMTGTPATAAEEPNVIRIITHNVWYGFKKRSEPTGFSTACSDETPSGVHFSTRSRNSRTLSWIVRPANGWSSGSV